MINALKCDDCGNACADLGGDPDRAVMCCVCRHRYAPKEYRWTPCEFCELRVTAAS